MIDHLTGPVHDATLRELPALVAQLIHLGAHLYGLSSARNIQTMAVGYATSGRCSRREHSETIRAADNSFLILRPYNRTPHNKRTYQGECDEDGPESCVRHTPLKI